MEDDPGELLPDGVHEVAEHREALVLVGDQRVDLGEAAQMDALAQVVHLVQVLFPAVVDDLEQDLALQVAHQLRAQFLLAALVGGQSVLGQDARDLLAARTREVELPEVGTERPQLGRLGLQAVYSCTRRVITSPISSRTTSDMSRPSRISRRYL